MNNRLSELGEIPTWAKEPEDNPDGLEAGETGNEWNEDPSKESFMNFFFSEVDNIKACIKKISDGTSAIGDINEEAVLATTTAKEKELSDILSPLVVATNKTAKDLKHRLDLLEKDNARHKEEETLKDSDLRIRENLTMTLKRKFIEELKAYQNAQQKYKSDIKKKIKRQVQIVKPDATDEEVDKVMQSEGGKDALFKERILAGGVNDSIKTAYLQVQRKHEDVKAIEEALIELHQMFVDFALLTQQQGEILDQIEFNVANACDYVEEANVEVHQAVEYQQKIRKKQCIILLIVTVILVILVVVFIT